FLTSSLRNRSVRSRSIRATPKTFGSGPAIPGRATVSRSATESINRPTAAKRGDRKSTRLNSSHVSISYAVFCLKKKKKQKLLYVVLHNLLHRPPSQSHLTTALTIHNPSLPPQNTTTFHTHSVRPTPITYHPTTF